MEIVNDDDSSVNKPLNGENYGIENELDKLESIYKSNIIEYKEEVVEPKPIEPTIENISRSKISLGDILS